VGGTVVPKGKYPWIAALKLWDVPDLGGCGATLIASRWAITAAHCAGNPRHHIISIVLGQYDIRNSSRDVFDINRKIVKVERAIIQDATQAIPYSNDLALLKLAEEVDLSVHTPACLPDPGRDFTGKVGTVYGWGRTDHCDPESTSSFLLETNLQIVSDSSCRKANGTYQQYNITTGSCVMEEQSFGELITPGMMCARGIGRSACNSDSGGPFTVRDGIQHSLAGVVSWGVSCAADEFFSVFVEVAKFRKWIDENISANGGATYC